MMKPIQFTLLNKQFLRVVIPILLAALFLATLLEVSASSASTIESPSADPGASILTNGNVITIGVAADLNGPVNWMGWRQANAVQLVVDQINAAGGVDIGGVNYTLTLVSADSGCNPTQAITATNTLLGAGVVAVVGHTCSGTSNAAQPLYAAAEVPMVSASSTAPQLTEQGYTTTFRVISRDGSPASKMATYLFNEMGYQNAAIVELNTFWGNFANDVFLDTFSSLGGTITSHNAISSTANFTATLTTIMTENPDVIHFPNDNGSTAGLLSKVAHNLGMTNVVVAWTTFTQDRSVLDDYAAIAGIAAEGDMAAMSYRSTDLMPGYNDLNGQYTAAEFPNFGDEAQEWGAFAYDAAHIIFAAIDRADSTNPADIRDEIAATTNYQGVVGTYEGFDKKGDVLPQWAWMERYQNGQWVVIWPYEIFLPVTLNNSGQ
jgi:branched-chain amino acid transport system substrate-binding protein